jgi:hypothetical protein
MVPNGGGGNGRGNGRSRRSRAVYLWDNSPYVATGLLGAYICLDVHWVLAVIQLAATVLGPLWIMLRVCPSCFLYGSAACPSGYGLASSRMVEKGDPDRFGEVFSLHISAVAPMWFIPIAAVVYLLLTGGDVPWLATVAFVMVAFIGVPLKARYYTCARCPKRSDCPWGSRTALPLSGRNGNGPKGGPSSLKDKS